MYGNTPYAGRPGDEEVPELSPAARRALQEGVSDVERATRRFLPDDYQVGSRVGQSNSGPQVTISVRPPVGNPVSAGFTPDMDSEEDLIPVEDVDEVARGLAASAALQVKQAIGDDVPPMAR
ncbi:hypothetical protein HTSR_0132 [Halodesulfurarchaeum formicicum]|uniref:Uncharacterized protein n=1 Tax=Halodesulfurarchaeum formicicum TaxID=1873524 RepID=A0A1D8S1W8_9EURY|nr:DUF5811 family protein [Halodesulfurarchaeum formicicum]AOW79340.1 hypothetical protein HTSR_0132 [Halodesulfurarchaeum formicicum]APE94605.1 hypothetical protein HSR6_0131 [Halodesulfurarchaeum formicicum]